MLLVGRYQEEDYQKEGGVIRDGRIESIVFRVLHAKQDRLIERSKISLRLHPRAVVVPHDPREDSQSIPEPQVEIGHRLGASHDIQAAGWFQYPNALLQPSVTPFRVFAVVRPHVAKFCEALSDI